MSKKEQIILPEEAYTDSVPKSLYGNRSLEDVPVFDKSGSERIIGGDVNSNCFIVLGNDRPGGKASGKGGAGFTQCGKIDLVVGIGPQEPSTKKTNPNFFTDSARLYLSQKSNIDAYFGLAERTENVSSDYQSCSGLKADHVRIIGRNHIKLVTGKARINTSEKDSKGDEIISAGKIDLIAGNSTDVNTVLVDFLPVQVKALQPLIKGDNLELMLGEIIGLMSDIQNQVFANKKSIIELALSYQSHVHISPFSGLPTTPSPMALAVIPTVANCFTDLPSAFTIESNLASLTENYLNENFPLYIKSKNVNTT